MLAALLNKCFFHAFGAEDIKGSSASPAYSISLADLKKAGRTAVDKRTHAAAFRTEM
jgi:hypothetical protein